MSKLKNKFDNFDSALKRLTEANVLYKKYPGESVYADALIKRYEFTFELAWKTLREFIIAEGYLLPVASPKHVIAFAYREGFIDNELVWLEMLDARNNTAHEYGAEIADRIASEISVKYCKELTKLRKFLSDNMI